MTVRNGIMRLINILRHQLNHVNSNCIQSCLKKNGGKICGKKRNNFISRNYYGINMAGHVFGTSGEETKICNHSRMYHGYCVTSYL